MKQVSSFHLLLSSFAGVFFQVSQFSHSLFLVEQPPQFLLFGGSAKVIFLPGAGLSLGGVFLSVVQDSKVKWRTNPSLPKRLSSCKDQTGLVCVFSWRLPPASAPFLPLGNNKVLRRTQVLGPQETCPWWALTHWTKEPPAPPHPSQSRVT